MSKLAVIINRNARRFARDPALVSAVAHAAGPRAVIIETRDEAELEAAARQVRHAAPDLVALCGGDGTYGAGVTALTHAYGSEPLPALALVPGGTVATVARNIDVTGGPVEVLTRVAALASVNKLRIEPHATMRANEHIGFIFGAALVANFFDLYYADGARGLSGAAGIVSRIFASSLVGGPYARRVLDPVACTVTADGVALDDQAWSLVVCSTVRDAGLHMHVNYRAGERRDRLHLVASPLSTRELGPQMFRVIAGRALRGKGHFDGLVHSFRLEFPDQGPWVLDGDLHRTHAIEVRPGPEVRLVRGPLF